MTGECYNCLHPNLGVAAANGGYMPYQQVFCGENFLLPVAARVVVAVQRQPSVVASTQPLCLATASHSCVCSRTRAFTPPTTPLSDPLPLTSLFK